MLRNAKIDLLRRVTLFSGCSKRELGEIARITDEIDFPAGKVLIRQGEPGRQLFIIVEGNVDVTRDGKQLPSERGGSEFFGEIFAGVGLAHDRHGGDRPLRCGR